MQMLPRGNSRNKIFTTEELNRKGNQQRKKGQLNKAIQTFDKALANDPNSAEAWNNKAFVYQDKGLFDDSVTCFDKALQCDPKSKVLWNNKGGIYLEEGLFDEAIACFEEALKIDPDFDVAFNNKGVGLREKGHYEESIACHDRAIQLNPHYFQAWNNKGRCAHATGKPAEAIRCYDMAITINGKYTTGWLNKGMVLLDERLYLEAIACFDKVFSLDTTNARSMFYKGCSYRHINKYTKAVVAFDKAILADPRYSEAYHHKGDTLADQGKYTKALQTFQRALEIDPEDSYSRQRKQQLEKIITKLQLQQQQPDTPPKLDDSLLKARSVTLQNIPDINDNGKKNVTVGTTTGQEMKKKLKRALSQGTPLNSSVLFDSRSNTVTPSTSGPSPRRIPGPMRAGRSVSVSASVPRPRKPPKPLPMTPIRLGKESQRMEIAEFSGEALVVVAAPNGGEYLSAVLPSTHPLVVDLRRGLEQVSVYTVAKAEVIINQVHEEDFKERLEKGKGRPSDWAMDYLDDEKNEERRKVIKEVMNPENSYMIENEHEIPLARLFYKTSLNDAQNICANGFTSNSFDKTGRFGSGIYLTENLIHCFRNESTFTPCLMITDSLLLNKFALIHADAPHGAPVEDFRFYSSPPYKNAMTHIVPVVEYAPCDYRPPQDRHSNIEATEFVFFDEGNLIPRVLVHLKKKKKKKKKTEKTEKGAESEEEKFMKRREAPRRSTKSEEEGVERERRKDRKQKKGNNPEIASRMVRSRSANSTPERSRITHSIKTPTKDKITVPITTTSITTATTTVPPTVSTTTVPPTATLTTESSTATLTTAPPTATLTTESSTATLTTAPPTATLTTPPTATLTTSSSPTATLTTSSSPTVTLIAPPTATLVEPPTATLTTSSPTATLTAPPTATLTAPPTATLTAPPTATLTTALPITTVPTGNSAPKVELKIDRPDISWDTDQVVSWLGTLNLSEDYSSLIKAQAIDGEVLVTMTSNDDWKDLGMTKFGDIRKCIKALHNV